MHSYVHLRMRGITGAYNASTMQGIVYPTHAVYNAYTLYAVYYCYSVERMHMDNRWTPFL